MYIMNGRGLVYYNEKGGSIMYIMNGRGVGLL